MSKKHFWNFLAFVGIGFTYADTQAWGQNSPIVDNWSTLEECQKATGALFYVPTIVSTRKIDPAKEVIRGHPTGGCFEMDLPDRQMKKGFVRIEAGRPFVYDRQTGKLLRLAACNNDVHSWAPFTQALPQPAVVTDRPAVQVVPVISQPNALQRRMDTLVVIHKQEALFSLRASVDPIQMIMQGQPGGQGPNDYVVRSRGHKKLYTLVGLTAAGIAGYFIWQNNKDNGRADATKSKAPGVTTDSVTTPKCVATSYPNNCPGGNRLPGITILRFP